MLWGQSIMTNRMKIRGYGIIGDRSHEGSESEQITHSSRPQHLIAIVNVFTQPTFRPTLPCQRNIHVYTGVWNHRFTMYTRKRLRLSYTSQKVGQIHRLLFWPGTAEKSVVWTRLTRENLSWTRGLQIAPIHARKECRVIGWRRIKHTFTKEMGFIENSLPLNAPVCLSVSILTEETWPHSSMTVRSSLSDISRGTCPTKTTFWGCSISDDREARDGVNSHWKSE